MFGTAAVPCEVVEGGREGERGDVARVEEDAVGVVEDGGRETGGGEGVGFAAEVVVWYEG